ncbi:MAG: hypothetical protein M1828_003246 [Chrysothrix sp. TS-e1954]|nr:MAG: hypothetical protein M1828_003246 [Chrysothrix sp. TS-e1954]
MSGHGGRGGGRGAHYKARYGGGGRARGGQPYSRPPQDEHASRSDANSHIQNSEAGQTRTMQVWDSLAQDLRAIDNQQYGAYKRLQGRNYRHPSSWTLVFDHIQADPFASPSRVRVRMGLDTASCSQEGSDSENRKTALGDFFTRVAAAFIRQKHMDRAVQGHGWSGPKGGAFNINAPGQEVLPRTSCVIDELKNTIELRLTVSLPAKGRTVLGQEAVTILSTSLPELVQHTLLAGDLHQKDMSNHVRCYENQQYLRTQLSYHGLIAFIANGSLLPRQSGASSLPMTGPELVKFQSPRELEGELKDLSSRPIRGMGIKKGVTVLTGGGFHGKSTVLEAVQLGVYNHVPGDGREQIVTDASAVKIRAEDGRSVQGLDISPFISNLPGKKDVKHFCSDDASGSTSMAASIQEALALGSKLLLIDEDSSATNLLIRDQRMQALVQSEPITPFVSSVGTLSRQHDVSTIIVVGGCGDYLSVADTVIGMDSYRPTDLTAASKEVVARFPSQLSLATEFKLPADRRFKYPASLSKGRPPLARGQTFIRLDDLDSYNPVKNPAEAEAGIDISSLEQIVEHGQVRLAAEFLRYCAKRNPDESVYELVHKVREKDLDDFHVEGHAAGDLVYARPFELGAALNRLRGIQVTQRP